MKSKVPVDLSKFDTAARQQDVLEYVLKEKKFIEKVPEMRVSVEEARQAESQLEIRSTREATRLLFISRDTTLLNQTTQSLDGYLNLSDVFDEVHIIILQPGIRTRNPVLRVGENVWLYVASAAHAWWTPYVALELIKNHLVFAGGFRPDLIVARDPYESALVAYIAGRHYDRPTQLHILQDFFVSQKDSEIPLTWWEKLFAWYLIPRFPSLRTGTDGLLNKIRIKYPHVTDTATLPRFRDLSIISHAPTNTIKNTYRQFSVVILYVGDFSEGSLAYQAIDISRELLRNPRVGLVMIGDGPARKECIKRADLLGLKTQIVFEKKVDDIASYFHTADMFIMPDTVGMSDEVIMQAASCGLPTVMSITPLRVDLFVDGESAFLYEQNNVIEATLKLNRLLNENNLRRIFSENVTLMAESRLHEDPVVYRQAYRDSVEQALLVGDEIRESESLE